MAKCVDVHEHFSDLEMRIRNFTIASQARCSPPLALPISKDRKLVTYGLG